MLGEHGAIGVCGNLAGNGEQMRGSAGLREELVMLSSLLFLFGIILFEVVLLWSVLNDAPGTDGGTKGLLAMKDGAEAPAQRRRQRQ